jgi:hypothetical protein
LRNDMSGREKAMWRCPEEIGPRPLAFHHHLQIPHPVCTAASSISPRLSGTQYIPFIWTSKHRARSAACGFPVALFLGLSGLYLRGNSKYIGLSVLYLYSCVQFSAIFPIPQICWILARVFDKSAANVSKIGICC